MHRGRLFLIFTLHVLIGNRKYPLHFADPHPASILDADEFFKPYPPLLGIGKFEQQRDLPIPAIGNQRVVGIEFALYSVAFKYPFGAQHLEYLVTYRGGVLKTPGHVGPDLHIAQLLVGNDLAAHSSPVGGVFLQAHEIPTRQFFHVVVPLSMP
jgi:hypothetical protein